ncbi:MAG: hypothetical protein A2017_05990 [Lentisphaerae bacterium GWF2_44_16]|nr:MAG: hypothetical protein A2017_05990 [Lentisphaerae bacterium GWF2_44_16]
MKSGERLSGETQLAQDFNVSRVTVREALEVLEHEKLIKRVQGKGTFVSENIRGRDACFMEISSNDNNFESPSKYICPGIEKRLNEAGIRLERCSSQFIRNISKGNACSLFRENLVQGIFLLECNFTGREPEIEILKASGLPVIVPHAHNNDRNIVNFAIMQSDNRLAFGDGLRHFASQGHKKVGVIFSSTTIGGMRGFVPYDFKEFLNLNSFDSDDLLIKYAEYSKEAINHAVRELMLGPKSPTAIMCHSDFYAIHVYDALKELNICIPEQVAVMGYCGYPGGQYISPSLSTVDLMYENVGRMAADLMLKSDEWAKAPKSVTMITPHRILIRKSTENKMKYSETPEFCMIESEGFRHEKYKK